MSILNKFLSGTQKKNRGHLANIVKIARSDGKLNRDEIRLLKKVKKDLNINDVAFRTIIRKPELYPINPPVSYQERIERLYALTNMLLVDKTAFDMSLKILEKLAVGIGFPIQTHKQVVETAVDLVQEHTDIEKFTTKIKLTNSVVSV